MVVGAHAGHMPCDQYERAVKPFSLGFSSPTHAMPHGLVVHKHVISSVIIPHLVIYTHHSDVVHLLC